ncbi:hypothetical protein D3C86_1845040 [compost metagenome]
MVVDELDELGVARVDAEAPRNAFDEIPQEPVAELRPTPGARAHQWREEQGFTQPRARRAGQQVVQQDGATGALPGQVPGLRQVQGRGFAQQGFKDGLVLGEVADAGPRATG